MNYRFINIIKKFKDKIKIGSQKETKTTAPKTKQTELYQLSVQKRFSRVTIGHCFSLGKAVNRICS